MKRIMLAAIAVALVAINPAASADPGWNAGGHGGGSHNGGNNGGGNSGGGYHGGDGHGPGYHPPSAPSPQGKNNAGRRPHYGNGSNNGYYAGYPYQGKNNAGRRPHYGNGSPNYYAGYPYHGGPYHGGGYPYKGWYGHAGYYYPRPYYGHPYYPYRPVGGYYGYPYYYGQHHNNNNNSDWPAYLIGGAILGSVLTNVYHDSQAQQYAAPANQVIVAPQGRRLLRDLNGNCYERSTDSAGNELRTELPPSECNW